VPFSRAGWRTLDSDAARKVLTDWEWHLSISYPLEFEGLVGDLLRVFTSVLFVDDLSLFSQLRDISFNRFKHAFPQARERAGSQDVTNMLCRPTPNGLTVLAPAKLNLFLRVVARRPDGYHDIESVMASVDFYDTLNFERTSTSEIELKVVDNSPRSKLTGLRLEAPSGPENLVVRAAMLLREHTGCRDGIRIVLVKRIPSSAGLGGGSSDCAATLGALNRLWKLQLKRDELLELAGRLGSDVPFFMSDAPMATCTGRGEQIEPLRFSTNLHFVIAKPASGLSTPAVYRACRVDETGQDVASFVDSLRCGDIGAMAQRLHNGLQAPAESLSSDVRNLRLRFDELSVIAHQMSGSGSAYFGVCRSRPHAARVASRLRALGVPWVKVVRSCP
jgi:4-diphosphocytidyl-2-C-methyl-D-erythritol kinase